MNFVNEDNGARCLRQLLHHRLEALFKVAPILGTGDEAAQIQTVDHRLLQQIGDPAFHHQPGQAFGDGGFADAGLTHQQRIVLATPTQRLHDALDLVLAPDQGVDLATGGAFIQVDRILLQRRLPLAAAIFALLAVGRRFGGWRRLAALGDAVRDVVDHVQTAHTLLAQQINRVGVFLGEQRHQHVERRHLFFTGRLYVVDRALQYPLERQRGLNIAMFTAGIGVDVVVDVLAKLLLQALQIRAGGGQHLRDIGIRQQRKQQMLDGEQLMAFAPRRQESRVQRLL